MALEQKEEINQEKESLATKLDSLTTLITALQKQTAVLKKVAKSTICSNKKSFTSKAKIANENPKDGSPKFKTDAFDTSSNTNKASRLVSNLPHHGKNDKPAPLIIQTKSSDGKNELDDSSDRLSKLAKATWNTKKGSVDFPKRLPENGKYKIVKYTNSKELEKEGAPNFPKRIPDSDRYKLVKNKNSEDLDKGGPPNFLKRSPETSIYKLVKNENCVKFPKETKQPSSGYNRNINTKLLLQRDKLMFEKYHKTEPCVNLKNTDTPGTKIIDSAGDIVQNEANSDPLEVSSQRLSSLAKNTWKHLQIKRLEKYTHPRLLGGKESNTWSKLGDTSSSRIKNYKVSTKSRNYERLDSLSEDVSNNSPVDCGETSTDARLSNLAKKVWIRKVRHRNFDNAFGSRFIKKGLNIIARNHGKASGDNARAHIHSDYKWRAKEDNSFLQRRSSFIIKQNRFSIVKGQKPLYNYKLRLPSVSRVSLAGSLIANNHQGARNSFLYRRQAYLYTSQDAKASRTFPPSSAYKKSNLHLAVPKKAEKNSKIYFNVSGRKFQTDVRGRRLRRISSSAASSSEKGLVLKNSAARFSSSSRQISHHGNKYKFIRRESQTPQRITKIIASRVIKKSVVRLQQHKIRKLVKKQYCMFYNRFGKCKNGNKCIYKHDPDKIAVCTRFLRGTCKEENCLFSHKIDSKKMPTCSFFLRGMCHKDNCPYAHVKVSVNADVCKDFLKGHCPNGDKCLKKHILECSEFLATGNCQDGENCKLYHRKRVKRKRRSFSGTRAPVPFLKKAETSKSDGKQAERTDPIKETRLQIKPAFGNFGKSSGLSPRKRKRKFDWKKDMEKDSNPVKRLYDSS